MNEIHFVLAQKEHIPDLIESRIRFLSEYWGQQETSVENDLKINLKAFFEREIPSREYVSWLAFEGEQCIAAGGMKILSKPGSFRVPDGRSAYIMNMFTLPAYRTRGIGREILRRLMESGQKMGIRFFELHATEEGEPLYIKTGFQKHKEPTYRLFIEETIS